MTINRRRFLGLTAAGLVLATAARGRAAAIAGVPALRIVEPLGRPSVIWTTSTALQPALGRVLQCPVEVETVLGDDSYNALHAALKETPSEVRLWGGAIMATQYVGTIGNRDVKLEQLTPVARLSDGFSVCLFAKKGGGLAGWGDVKAAAPLKVSCLERATAAYVAKLMLERKGGVTIEETLRKTIGEVIADVVEGRTAAGIIPTNLVARQHDTLTPLVTFGAKRNAFVGTTPTFAELVGNPKLAFTESVGVLGAPGLATAAALSAAFVQAANDPEVDEDAEAEDFPLVVSSAEVLRQTMERNQRLLARLIS
jgi:tripartite-type tricarboxylate transporter receptor subunit TctC